MTPRTRQKSTNEAAARVEKMLKRPRPVSGLSLTPLESPGGTLRNFLAPPCGRKRQFFVHQLRNLYVVCPTCWCFDIQDEGPDKNSGERIRLWDSCMFPLFTLHGGRGHNTPVAKAPAGQAAFFNAQAQHLPGQIRQRSCPAPGRDYVFAPVR